MTYSYTQISHYLRCPRSYRYRYIDGWREKENPSICFGRCFEKALGAVFLRQDGCAVLFKEWATYRAQAFEYKHGENWELLYRQGINLLTRLAQDGRVHVPQPLRNMQVKITKSLHSGHEFVAFIDALGQLDGKYCLLEWKTTAARYLDEPTGICALDPQLICYSWITGVADVAIVAFVRKRQPEIQYLKVTITEQQRSEFDEVVHNTIRQIAIGDFPQRNGIRFPQSNCTSCSQLGHCLAKPELIAAKLVRQPGASDLDWLDHFDE